ncbi:unnamed protein product [Durusdinium trenchii]|uniref:Uncharacterized protein n=1 Tax=Durusdinium trenchii TaxID=1381693 RepID=A0ABP0MJD9_9DINO
MNAKLCKRPEDVTPGSQCKVIDHSEDQHGCYKTAAILGKDLWISSTCEAKNGVRCMGLAVGGKLAEEKNLRIPIIVDLVGTPVIKGKKPMQDDSLAAVAAAIAIQGFPSAELREVADGREESGGEGTLFPAPGNLHRPHFDPTFQKSLEGGAVRGAASTSTSVYPADALLPVNGIHVGRSPSKKGDEDTLKNNESVVGEKDACGVGRVALRALSCMEHRGACSGGMDSGLGPTGPGSPEELIWENVRDVQVLLLSNLPRTASVVWYTTLRESAVASHRLQVAFASGCLFLLSLALLCFHKLCRTRPGLVLTLEMVTAAYTALESIVWSHGQQEMMASVLLVYIVCFFILRTHPVPILLQVVSFNLLLYMPWTSQSSEKGRIRMPTWWDLEGGMLISNPFRVKLLLFSLWLLFASTGYLTSFMRKIHAVKTGAVGEARTGPRGCWPRLASSMDPAVHGAEIMARSFRRAWSNAGCLWVGHLICLDLLGEMRDEQLWNCSTELMAPAISCGACLFTVIWGLEGRRSQRRLGLLWGEDVPLVMFSSLPPLLTASYAFWIRSAQCFSGDKTEDDRKFEPVAFAVYADALLWLTLVQCLMAAATITLASTHPLCALLGAAALLAGASLVAVINSRFDVKVLIAWVLIIAVVTAQMVCHTLDYLHLFQLLRPSARDHAQSLELSTPSSHELEGSHLDGSRMSRIGSLPIFEKVTTARMPAPTSKATSSGLGPSSGSRSSGPSSEGPTEVHMPNGRRSTSKAAGTILAGSAVAVVRHGEREDTVWNSLWYQSDDAKQHPYDCPITAEGVRQARDIAKSLHACSNFGIVVSSPYLRCVQTAVIIAERLGLMVLLDHELGEVFGRSVFSDMSMFQDGVITPWRSRRTLYETMKQWKPEGCMNCKTPVQHVCWKRILGQPPVAGESLSDARKRYARRFLTYLARSRRAEKNVVVVSHGHMMEACLKVLPSTCSERVNHVPFCGGFLAQLTSRDGAEEGGLDSAQEEKLKSDASSWESEEKDATDKDIHSAELASWIVKLFGIDLRPTAEWAPNQEKRKKFLTQLKVDRLTWEYIQHLLGELPDTAMVGRARSDSAGTAMTARTDASDNSMYLFRRPSFSESVAFSDTTDERMEHARRQQAERAATLEKANPISLQSNPLLSRRQRMGRLGEEEAVDTAPAPVRGRLPLQNNPLLNRRPKLASPAADGAEQKGVSLQSNPLLNRRPKADEADADGRDRPPVPLQSNPLLMRRQKLSEKTADAGASTSGAQWDASDVDDSIMTMASTTASSEEFMPRQRPSESASCQNAKADAGASTSGAAGASGDTESRATDG